MPGAPIGPSGQSKPWGPVPATRRLIQEADHVSVYGPRTLFWRPVFSRILSDSLNQDPQLGSEYTPTPPHEHLPIRRVSCEPADDRACQATARLPHGHPVSCPHTRPSTEGLAQLTSTALIWEPGVFRRGSLTPSETTRIVHDRSGVRLVSHRWPQWPRVFLGALHGPFSMSTNSLFDTIPPSSEDTRDSPPPPPPPHQKTTEAVVCCTGTLHCRVALPS